MVIKEMSRRAHCVRQWRIRGWALHGRIPGGVRAPLEEAIRAVPDPIMGRLPALSIHLQPAFTESGMASTWTDAPAGVEIRIATEGISPHDCAIELLLCASQVLWDRLDESERLDWFRQLQAEIEAGVAGEIDEAAVREKRMLLSSRAQASSVRRLESYARQSFASTAAEYCHALWHDVGVRRGKAHLPAAWLRRRFELLARWFPPGRTLFAPAGQDRG